LNKVIMKISMSVLIFVTVIFTVLAILQLFVVPSIDFSNWYVVLLLGIFALTQIICIITQKFSFKKIGFYLLHIGLIAFLLGNFMYFMKGQLVEMVMPIDGMSYSSIKKDTGEFIDLGFGISINEFNLEKYPDTEVDKWYEVKVTVNRSGIPENEILAVNNPVRANGWKMYLIDYSGKSIGVLFKYDPGEYISLMGLWMIISGSFIMCFSGMRRKVKAGDDL